MAVFVFYVPPSTVGLLPGGDAGGLSLELYGSSSSELVLGANGVTLEVLYGDFELDAAGEPVAGTLTGWTTWVAPDGIALESEASGLAVDLISLAEWVYWGDEIAIADAFFGGDDLFICSSGDDVLGGYTGHDTLLGGAGDDLLDGGLGRDRLVGGDGADLLWGDAGADWLDGGAQADLMFGGAGNDTYCLRQAGDTVSEESDSGTDMVLSWLPGYRLGDAVENATVMTTGSANLTGNDLDNLLVAGAGANRLAGGGGLDTASYARAEAGVRVSLALTVAQSTGGSGIDTLTGIEHLRGSDYADRLFGNAQDNMLTGGGGADLLAGRKGNDTLVGNAGTDRFRLDTPPDPVDNVDTFIGFRPTQDGIELDNAVFTALGAPGMLTPSMFRANRSASPRDADDHLLYETDTGRLYYDADGNGEGAAVLIAVLQGAPALNADNFFVV